MSADQQNYVGERKFVWFILDLKASQQYFSHVEPSVKEGKKESERWYR